MIQHNDPSPHKPGPLDQIVNVRLTGEMMNALRLEAAESDESISGTARSLIVTELARLHPELLGHLVDDDVENALADQDAEQDRQETLQAKRDDFNFPGGSS